MSVWDVWVYRYVLQLSCRSSLHQQVSLVLELGNTKSGRTNFLDDCDWAVLATSLELHGTISTHWNIMLGQCWHYTSSYMPPLREQKWHALWYGVSLSHKSEIHSTHTNFPRGTKICGCMCQQQGRKPKEQQTSQLHPGDERKRRHALWVHPPMRKRQHAISLASIALYRSTV